MDTKFYVVSKSIRGDIDTEDRGCLIELLEVAPFSDGKDTKKIAYEDAGAVYSIPERIKRAETPKATHTWRFPFVDTFPIIGPFQELHIHL